MPRKPKKPPLEISDKEPTFTFSPPSPTPGLLGQEKKEDILSLLLKRKPKTCKKDNKTNDYYGRHI